MPVPDWAGYHLVDSALRLSTDAEVDAVEDSLGVALPAGYRELVTTLGAGTLSLELGVHPPRDILTRSRLLVSTFNNSWFFDETHAELTREDALESVGVATTADGDEVIYHPGSGRLHVLPRHDDRTYVMGGDLWEAVDWFHESGVLRPRLSFRSFDLDTGPGEAVNGHGHGASLPQARRAVIRLGVHEALEERENGCTMYVAAIGGYLTVLGTSTGACTPTCGTGRHVTPSPGRGSGRQRREPASASVPRGPSIPDRSTVVTGQVTRTCWCVTDPSLSKGVSFRILLMGEPDRDRCP